jgi:hypothetical protein
MTMLFIITLYGMIAALWSNPLLVVPARETP